MKRNLVTAFMCLISFTVRAQTFTESYKQFAKESKYVNDNSEHIRKIFSAFGLNVDDYKELAIAECQFLDFSKDSSAIQFGVVATPNITFTYSYNTITDEVKITNDFIADYKKIDKSNSWSIMYFLTQKLDIEGIAKLAVDEMNNDIKTDPNGDHKWQFEVVYYNSNSLKKVRLCYLHESLIKVFK